MELKEIKCQNCGAKLEVGLEDHEVTCKYCNTKFTIDDEYSKSYKTAKGILDAQTKQAEEYIKNHPEETKLKKIIIGISIVILLCIIMFSIYQVIDVMKFDKKAETIINTQLETTTINTDIDKKIFNASLETVAGSTSYFFLSDAIDDIITSNKKNVNHQITITYDETTAITEDEIVTLKSQIKNSVSSNVADELYVSYTYDDEGYITNMKVLNQA